MRRVQQSQINDELTFTKFPVQTAPCDHSVNFKNENSGNVLAENLEKFTCLDNSDIVF